MSRRRLTEQNVTALPTKRQPYRIWDAGTEAVRGLHILIQPSGTRSYRVAYRFKGSPKEHALHLGRVGEVSLEEARTRALEVRRAAAKGDDPKADDPISSDAFKTCIDTWIVNEQHGRKESVSANATQKLVLSACDRWHDRPIATLRYSEIDDLLCELRDGSKRRRRKTPYLANRVHAHLKTFFRWCVRTKRLPVSPMAEMPKPWLGAKARSRSWFAGEPADEMITLLWQAADDLGGDSGRFVKLLLITGKRRTAIETMRWDHVDSAWYWRPTLGTKTKRCHAIPLPKLAQRIVSPRVEKGRVLGPLNVTALAKQIRESTGHTDFIWHGIRHIVESKLAELRVPPHVRDMLLDHAAVRGAGAGYDHWAYVEEQREALELWCSHIERLVQPADTVRVLR